MFTFKVPGISCGHCVSAIEKAVRSEDLSAKVQVDLQAKTVTVVSTRDEEAIAGAIASAGYEVQTAAA